jgi:GGDEF domain-containing protein
MKIKTMLTLMGVWLSASAVVAFLIASSVTLGARTERVYINSIAAAAENHSHGVQRYIVSLEANFAALTEIVSGIEDVRERRAFLISYAENRPNIEYVGINGLIQPATDTRENHSEMSQRAVNQPQNGRVFLFEYDTAPPTGEFGLVINGQIPNSSDILAVVYSGEVISTLIDSAALPAKGRLAVTDYADNALEAGIFRGGQSSLELRRGETEQTHSAGDTGWTIVAFGNVGEARELAGNAHDNLLITVIALCLAGIALTLLIVRKLATPLEIAEKAMSQFRRGDHTVRISVSKSNGRNEYGEMAARFNDFAAQVTENAAQSKIQSESGERPRLRISSMRLDALTGVYTDESIRRIIGELIPASAQDDEEFADESESPGETPYIPFALIIVELNKFDDFIEEYGHAGGDLMLKFAGFSLSNTIGKLGKSRGKIGRSDVNEFAVVLKAASELDLSAIVEHISKRLLKGYLEDTGRQVIVDAKVSFTLFNEAPHSVDAAVSAARSEGGS